MDYTLYVPIARSRFYGCFLIWIPTPQCDRDCSIKGTDGKII